MRKGLVGLFLGFLFLAFTQGSSFADMGGKNWDMGMRGAEHRMWVHLKDLGLDDNQKEAMKDIRSRAEKDAVKKKADLQLAGIDLRDILRKDPVDIKAAEAKLKQLEALRTDLHLARIMVMEEVKSKLTPEQRKKFTKSLERHVMREHGRKGMSKREGDRGKVQPPAGEKKP
ncbi:MAG TPA: periplasmic heavy metal sensor [Thermodesulfovibrionales bacterium]|nr:periplasmic heavy metal sensor [Thermodesulfovibrionales bacterium]